MNQPASKNLVIRCLTRTPELVSLLQRAHDHSVFLEVRDFDIYLFLTDMDFLRVVHIGRTFLKELPLGRVNLIKGTGDNNYVLVEHIRGTNEPYSIRESRSLEGLPLAVRPSPLPMHEAVHHLINHPYGPHASAVGLVDPDGRLMIVDSGGYTGDCVKPLVIYDGPHRMHTMCSGDLLADLGNRTMHIQEKLDLDKLIRAALERNPYLTVFIERYCSCWSILWDPKGGFREHSDTTVMLLDLVAEMYNVPGLLKPFEDLKRRFENVK